jgi:hypothetical protein
MTPTPQQIEALARRLSPLSFSNTWYDGDGVARESKTPSSSSIDAQRYVRERAREILEKRE